ncbi:5-oxoprolinase [Rudanella paleaurantiibacter]|uniref:5-oxoprolinase n=1 Tax=Rudanella paleaurantiibacter TaxID=2614655 RepID=A0A7J5U133_9BACT|nr:hydantoinase B/oxoprolinase family protein [Rudanella paleaurantiibacter]KAB7731379.1 5-oxoprolinase [Rudanella paleaurantiibacter]
MTPTWQIWIDTGGTFTDGIACPPEGPLHRTKVLSSSRLRGQLDTDGRLRAPWLKAPIFAGYTLRVVGTGDTYRVRSLSTEGYLQLAPTLEGPNGPTLPAGTTVELFTGEEAPVLAARLLTETPLDQPFPPLEMRLGTTKGTNALLERKGGRVALIVTRGFRDLLLIGTQQRPNLFELAIPPAEVLYNSVLEADERIGADGAVVTPLAEPTLSALIADLRQQNPDAIAISLLNAYRNPTHENHIREALKRAGFTHITCSTDVSAAPGYVARTQTAVADAYLTPVLHAYLANVQAQLGPSATLRIMSSAGGLVRADLFRPKDSLLSGPAGGVIGAGQAGAAVFEHNGSGSGVLTLDMGGTSTDVARIQIQDNTGVPDYRFSTQIGPFDLQLPSLAIETVAAGGGSVCWYDQTQGRLRVGPHSAGANPGPACYGASGPGEVGLLTITDVNLLLGRLHPAQFGIPIFPEKAQAALQAVSQQANAPAEAILAGFARIADEAMAGAIRTISIARGFDPAEYSLLVFGGAGGLHGCSVARLLGMKRLVLPFDGGLLSAYGIGQARSERMAAQAVLKPLNEVMTELPDRIDALTQQATTELQADVGVGAAIAVTAVRVFMRLQGQESTVDIRYANAPQHLADAFRAAYEQRYGHYPAGRAVEVESIRVQVATAPPMPEPAQALPTPRPAQPAFQTDLYPAYDWAALQPGDTFTGPALLLNTTSSVFIEPGWQLTLQPNRDAVAIFGGVPDKPDPSAETDVEAIQLELFTRRFMSIAEEMGTQLQRTAFSTNVKERLDFSCALLDPRAQLVANAPHIPVHLGSLGVCARLCLEQLPLEPGDVVITNHPRFGGSHLPDVTLTQGVFTRPTAEAPKPVLVGYVINRAHHAEIGGKVPGSMPPDATTLAEEGVVLEPQYLMRRGEWLWDTPAGQQGVKNRFTDAPYPTRSLAENRADIEAALASLRAGETALLSLVQAYGLPTVHRYMERLKQSATERMARVLTQHEGAVFEATEALDDGHQIRVAIRVQNGAVEFDFRGTSAVHPHNLNANLSILHSAVLYVLRLWCNEDMPLNEGLMAPVRFTLPDSSFLNPRFPTDLTQPAPAVVGGNTEVSQRLVDTLLKALGLAACSYGTMNNFLFGGADFGYYETIGGGTGATVGAHGRSAVHQHMTNTKLTDPEELERRYPVRLRAFGIRAGSGGAGTWRGGDGIRREIEFLQPVQATLLSQHRRVPPYGLNGGEPGLVGQQWLVSTNGEATELPGIFTRAMQPGERIRIETPGGGGMGSNDRGVC